MLLVGGGDCESVLKVLVPRGGSGEGVWVLAVLGGLCLAVFGCVCVCGSVLCPLSSVSASASASLSACLSLSVYLLALLSFPLLSFLFLYHLQQPVYNINYLPTS